MSVTCADGNGYRGATSPRRRSRSQRAVQTENAEAGNGIKVGSKIHLPEPKPWGIVRFNEESRAFNTGNCIKLIGQDEWTEAYKQIRKVLGKSARKSS